MWDQDILSGMCLIVESTHCHLTYILGNISINADTSTSRFVPVGKVFGIRACVSTGSFRNGVNMHQVNPQAL
jgi:hypothetical protein